MVMMSDEQNKHVNLFILSDLLSQEKTQYLQI